MEHASEPPASAPHRSGFRRAAVIDIGTNSVKLLVADVSADHVVPLFEGSEQTRLGRGFYTHHVLQQSAIDATAEAVAAFAEKARRAGAGTINVIATSAARESKNPQNLARAVEAKSRLPLQIISGEQEADLAFQGVSSAPDLARHPMLILDVGGGSTEFIVGDRGHACFRESFKIGTVRLLEQLPVADPPARSQLEDARAWLKHFFHEKVAPKLRRVLVCGSGKTVRLVGTGGTSTILARIQNRMDGYDRERIDATRLSRRQVHGFAEWLWSMKLEQRRHIAGLPPSRADVILFGVLIYETVMEEFDFRKLAVSTRGLRFAALTAL